VRLQPLELCGRELGKHLLAAGFKQGSHVIYL